MHSHDAVWSAMDGLARDHGLSPSGLARRAGLDPTSFNVSKRRRPDGHLRWPTISSILSVLSVTGTSFVDFATRVEAEQKGNLQGASGLRGKKNGHSRAMPVDVKSRHVA